MLKNKAKQLVYFGGDAEPEIEDVKDDVYYHQ